ncbi:MAG: SusC/RagA family TonB-linked outer membrane protein [Carboxylicivirga sp.]|nr:SusC/RagA family TonB-linked outer membrane protein [Carboxylicivirga sp.]
MKKKSNLGSSNTNWLSKKCNRIMKLSALLFFVVAFTGFANDAMSQKENIKVAGKNNTVKNVLEEIEQQSGYHFVYNPKAVETTRVVTMEITEGKVMEILDQLFSKTDVMYRMVGDNIILTGKSKNVYNSGVQQNLTITGTVTDVQGDPLPGVNVYDKANPTNGVITGINGNYTIKLTNAEATLVYSFIGYTTQEVIVAGRSTVDITLVEESTGLSEVVVTSALGFKRQKRSLGYSTQKIKGAEITKLQAPSLVTGLAGKAAGVNVTIPNGVEGSSQRIIIRGNSSIQGDNQPLFIVDGIPIENKSLVSDIGSGGGVDWGSNLNNINPYDIEEFNILKGPTAAALYGARGANGVVIINTKKGRMVEKGIGIEYSLNHRWNKVYKYQDFQNEYGFGGPPGALWEIPKLYKNDAGEYYYPIPWGGDRPVYGSIPGGYNSWDLFSWYGSAASWGPRMEGQDMRWWDGEMRKYSPQPDNQKAFFKDGHTTTHNVAFSGGGEMGNVRFSLTRTSNDAVVYNSNFEQTTANLGSSINLSKRLKAKISATYTDYYRKNAPELGTGGSSYTKGPAYSYPRSWNPEIVKYGYKNEDGSRNSLNGYPYSSIDKNIWWKTFENNTELDRKQLLGSTELIFNATSWLDFLGRAGIDYSTVELETKNNPTDNIGIKDGYYEHRLHKYYVENFDAIVTAHKDGIIEGINASLSVGATSWYKRDYGIIGKSLGEFKDPYLFTFQNYSSTVNTGRLPKEEKFEKRINSVYSFLNLSYRNFLFLDITGRNDWSSTLPEKNNSYFYPSFSSSFVFSEVTNLPSWISYGKVRIAYAKAATDAEPYRVYPTYSTGSWGGKPTSSMPDKLPAVELKPQISETIDYGLEFELFDSRLNFDFTYYDIRTKNQILDAPISWTSGFSGVTINSGKMQNRGIELTLTGVIVDRGDFGWTATLNAAKNKNKLLALDEGVEELPIKNGSIWGSHHGVDMAVKVGDEYGVIRGKNKVYNEDGRPIVDLYYAKGDDSQIIGAGYRSSQDAEIIGNAAPKLTGGLSNMIHYKNFSFSALVDFKWGGDIWAGDYATARMGGLSPSTLKERNGGGLPYTYPSGETANHGVIIDGVIDVQDYTANPDGEPIWQENDKVVNYLWKYGRNGWSMGLFPQTDGIVENTWVKLREVSLTYDVPRSLIEKTNIFQRLTLSVIGRDLFYFYTTIPDNINPEGVNGTGNAQGLMFGATPGQRSFGFSVRAIF